ncbi:hypothetical protein K439DRAFT_1620392 [Ramaria rubella]|nr:hypothetical protein K439DRAFT_1620392 [Ramaria rubella]
MYTLEDEAPLEYSMLVAMDGNELLKHVERARRQKNSAGKIVLSENTEREDIPALSSLTCTSVMMRSIVLRIKKHHKEPATDKTHENVEVSEPICVQPAFVADAEGRPVDGVEKPNPCVQRWVNLADESPKKWLGIFYETGLFLSVCCHGTALFMCNMVQSGELARCGLVITNELLDAFGDGLMQGYDIGCGFSTTANNSQLLGPKLRELHGRYCVGYFHGHAHSRLCQLDWHPLYIQGCGLEDFETCERVFLRSNALASSTRHASRFHCRQLIHRWFETWNHEKYTETSKFLYNNYVQALHNIASLPDYIAKSMRVLKIPSEHTFEMWRLAKKTYLNSLKEEALVDILKMEYLATLQKLKAADDKWAQALAQWRSADITDLHGVGGYARAASQSHRLETACARSLNTLLTLQQAVSDLEAKLEIETRWEPGGVEWIATQSMVDTRKYQQALNHLEGLVVARLFELSKAHHLETGYKLRKHIGKALKS